MGPPYEQILTETDLAMAILAQETEEVDFLKFLIKDLPTPVKISIITGTLYADWAALFLFILEKSTAIPNYAR